MRWRGAGKLAWVVLALSGVACGNEAKTSSRSQAAKTSDTAADTSPKAATGDPDLGVSPFAYGAYLAADLAPAGAELGLEFGIIYMRKQNYTGATNILDYQWVQATAFATGGGFLPKKAANGCADATFAAPAAATATAVSLSGSLTDALPAVGPLFQLEDFKREKTVSRSTLVTANVTTPAGTFAIASPALPSPDSYIGLSGAFDVGFSTSMHIADLNTNLGRASNELKLRFAQKSERENLAIVTFYGGAAATTKAYRCYLPAGGTVVIPSAVYKALLPVRAMTGVFANVQTKADAGATVWSSSIYGSGIIDQAVP